MYRIAILAVLVGILQLTAVTYTRIAGFAFDLPIIVLVFFSFRHVVSVGVALGLFFGIFNGLFGLDPFWYSVFSYTAVGFLIGLIREWFYKENLLVFLLMVFLSLAVINFFKVCFPSLAYSLAMAVFLFYFLRELGL